MQVDPALFDRTQLDELEQKFVIDVLKAVGDQLVTLAMTQGVVAATQAAAGSVARMIKANLASGLQQATLADVRQLKLPGVS